MAFSKPLTQAEIDYILDAKNRKLPNQRIAEELGRSVRVVQKVIKEHRDDTARVARKKQALKRIAPVRCATPKKPKDLDVQDTLGRLREAREILRVQMLEAEARNVASIVREYRAVCLEIERLEAGVEDDGADIDPIAARLISFNASSA